MLMEIEKECLPSMETAMKILAGVSTATLTTQLLKNGMPSTFIKGVFPLNPRQNRFVGEAYTLRLIPMREDKMKSEVVKSPDYPQRKCIESCPPRQVLVAGARGVTDVGIYGDILMTRMMIRGVAAVVCDGAMRDVESMAQMEILVFCSGGQRPAT
jgi:regulator of RNase E activity RraA